MTYIKTLTVLAGLALLTACGGTPTPTATDDSSSSQTTDCEANPFAASCIAEDLNVEARITDCITAGNAGDTKCASLTSNTAMNTAINTCLANPFDDTCTASGFTFSTHADDARVNRVRFCASDSTNSSLCTALTTCQKNPFGASCGAYFESAKNPYCETNPAEAPCVNIADWTGSFTDTLATAPVSTHTANQFLSGLTDTPPVVDGFILKVVSFGNSLTLAENELSGNATDGASFFSGSFNQKRYYAGIHASTDLGAPLDNRSQSGIWTGWIRGDGFITLDERFDLTVTFHTATQGGIIAAFVGSSTLYYDIDGDFDENGVITGTVTFGFDRDNDEVIDMMSPVSGGAPGAMEDDPDRTPGILTGLIGQDGVVAAFVSTTNTDTNDDMLGRNPFTGAFVALPPRLVVNTADWLGSFGQTSPPTTPDVATEQPTHKNQFLEISATDASTLTQGLVPTSLFITGSTENGLAFFAENGAFYAGVLANTNLGAPITETITTAVTWTGEIRTVSSSNTGVLTKTDFGLDITFNGTRGTITTIAIVPVVNTIYEIDGTFDANGVISGDVIFSASKVIEDNRVLDTDNESYSPGTLRGIIGSNGAVGVFISGHETLTAGSAAPSYSGGFVVTPPAP